MLFLIETDSVEIEAESPAEAARRAIQFLRNDPSEISLTVVPYDLDEHGQFKTLELGSPSVLRKKSSGTISTKMPK